VASRELQLTLTARDKEKKQPMCGVPYHATASPFASRWKTPRPSKASSSAKSRAS
jgi:hypothetical protein